MAEKQGSLTKRQREALAYLAEHEDDEEGEIVYENGECWLGTESKLASRTLTALLQRCALSLIHGSKIGEVERYGINETGRALLASSRSTQRKTARSLVSDTSQDLTPPDRKRCQAEKPNPNAGSFMTLGPRPPALLRCDETPTMIAVELRPGKDGKLGAMSLCDSCKAVFDEQMGTAGFAFEPIARRRS